MTICIGALCEDGTMVVCASDRMLTAGDIQFQPPQPKVWPLTNSVYLLYAGDASMQSEICWLVSRDVTKRVEERPDDWWEVRVVAQLYAKHCNDVRFRRAEQAILAPLGMDYASFQERQKNMEPGIVKMITQELLNYRPPGVEVIVAGRDKTGGHLYLVDNGEVSCHDMVAFASVGTGAAHANSHFMFAGHSRSSSFPKTLLLTYAAKRRAEVAPGVGEATDVFVIGPLLGQSGPLAQGEIDPVERILASTREAESKAMRKAEDEVTQYVRRLLHEAAAAQRSLAQDGGGSASPDEQIAGDVPENGSTEGTPASAA